MLEFHALGSVSVTDHGAEVPLGGPRQRRLLAALLVHRDAVVSVDRLAEAVFAGDPPPGAATTLRSYVARLRRVIASEDGDEDGGADGGPALLTQSPGYLLRVPEARFDVARADALVAEGRAMLARDDPAGAAPLLREALALWRGDAYAEFADEGWVLPEAQRLSELRLNALEARFEADLACGRAAALVPELEAAVAGHPLREGLQAQLMLALYRTGRHAEALRVFTALRAVLAEELGLDPSPPLADLERRILAHDPTLLLAEPAGASLRGYRLGARLGTGKDGTVLAASSPGVDRELVIRVVRAELADDPDFIRTFEPTLQRVAALRHPAVVAVHDYWREPRAAYVVLQRLYGGTLDDRLRRGPLLDAELRAVVLRVGGALAAAAAVGVVHGGVSPRNVLFDGAVLLGGEASPYLTDFWCGGPDAPSPRQDVDAFLSLVRTCAGNERGAVHELVDGLGGTAVSMAEVVEALTAVVVHGRTLSGGRRENPYKGLRAFDETDAADFVGRDALVAELLRRLGGDGVAGRLVLLVGGSGTGKSSVVRAGLLPRVRTGGVPGSARWFVTTMVPGGSPWLALAEAVRSVAVVRDGGSADDLARELAGEADGIDRVVRRVLPDDGQLLLVVDQLEELFTTSPEPEQRAFLNGLLQAVTVADSRVRVVATLRADFYDRPLAVPGFGAAVNATTVTIPAMSALELEAAVVEPALRVGRSVERSLVTELVTSVADRPAALPSLQFALFELAERCPDGLTAAAHRELGGLEGAIAARAEALHRDLTPEEQDAVRLLFERLVVVGEGEPTGRRAARAEVVAATGGAIDGVIDRWVEARLLSADRDPRSRVPTVELAHEALLRTWPRLQGWIDEDRGRLHVLGRLQAATAEWLSVDRDPDVLLRGARLQVALDTVAAHPDALTDDEQAFLAAARAARDRTQQELVESAARQARANRRLRLQLTLIGLALVVALVGGFVAVDQRHEAQERGAEAERERRVATARELAAAADANVDDDPERSILLALAAIDTTRPIDGTVRTEAVDALHRAVTASRIVRRFPDVGGSVDWSPEGDVFLTEGQEDTGVVDFRDADTGASRRAFVGHEIDVNEVEFSDDGTLAATTGDDGALRVWSVATGDLVSEVVVPDGGSVWAPAFSPDGARVAASFLGTGEVLVAATATGAVERSIPWDSLELDWSPDGRWLAIAGDPQALVVDADTGTAITLLGDEDGTVRSLAFSPDGRWLALTSLEGSVRLYGTADWQVRFTTTAWGANLNAVDWSPDSTLLAAAANDGTAHVVEVGDGGLRDVFALSALDTGNGLADLAFSPDGRQLMTGDWGIASTIVWDVSNEGGAEVRNAQGIEFYPVGTAYGPDGSVAVSHGDGSLTLVDTASGEIRFAAASLSGEPFTRVAATPDGSALAASTFTGPTEVFDTATGERLGTIPTPVPDMFVNDLDWNADGSLLAIGASDDRGRITVAQRDGTVLTTLVEEELVYVGTVDFLPDGEHLATARWPDRDDPGQRGIRIWDWRSGEVVRTLATPSIRADVDPSGRWVVAARQLEGQVDVLDLETGALVHSITGPAPFYDVAIRADGEQMATAGADGVVRLWDVATGASLGALEGHGAAVVRLGYGPDGRTLASRGDDGVVRVWTLDLDELVGIARRRLTRGLTEEECRQFLQQETCPVPAS
jgi:WD40 repeat protein/DNA-binding SARP family transcriptional activator